MGKLMFDTPTFEVNADNGPLLTKIASAMIVIATLGVLLRFYSKKLIRQAYYWDDWLILLALPCVWALNALEIFGVKSGNIGRHIQHATPNSMKILFIGLYAGNILFIFSLTLAKFSATLLYRRLFHVPANNIPLLLFEITLGLRHIASIIVVIFPCIPIQSFWIRTIPGKCINLNAFYTATGVTNIATDLVIMIFPMPIIWRLQIYRAQKVSVYAFFIFASSVVLFSIVRLVSIIESTGDKDITWAFFPVAFWTTVEASLSVFCACIPSMRPLIRYLPSRSRIQPSQIMINDDNASPRREKRWWYNLGPSGNDEGAQFRRMGDSIEESLGFYGPRTLITANNMELGAKVYHPEGIRVEREITVT